MISSDTQHHPANHQPGANPESSGTSKTVHSPSGKRTHGNHENLATSASEMSSHDEKANLEERLSETAIFPAQKRGNFSWRPRLAHMLSLTPSPLLISLNLGATFLASLFILSPSFAQISRQQYKSLEPFAFAEGTLTNAGKKIFLKAWEYVAIQKKMSDAYHINPRSYPSNINMLNGFNCALNVNHVLNAADKPSYDLKTWGSSLKASLIGINELYGYEYPGEYKDPQRTSVVLGRNDKNYSAVKFVWFKNKAPRSMNLNEFLSESGLNKGIPVGSVILAYLFYGGDNGCDISYGASGHTGIVGDVGGKNMVSGNNGKIYQANDLQDIILYHSNWEGIGNVSHQNQWVPDSWITLMFGENENKRIIEDYQVNSKFSTIRPDNRCFDKMEIIIPKDIWNEYSMTSSTGTSTIEHHLPSSKAGRQNIHY